MCTKRLSVIKMKGNSVFKENPFENNTYENRKIALFFVTDYVNKIIKYLTFITN